MKRMMTRRIAAGALSLFTMAACGNSACGQGAEQPNVYLSVSVDAKQKMQMLDGFVAQKNWAEAVDLLVTLSERQGDRLAPTTLENPTLFVNIRTYCNARLAALPPEALVAYRARVDGQADALWKEWEATRNVRTLRKLVDDFFCSTVGDRATDRMGDIAFANGRFSDAVGWWLKLLPPEWANEKVAAGSVMQSRFPRPRTDDARIAAKCLIAKTLAGDEFEAARMTSLLRQRHPESKGTLGGETGMYLAILGKLSASKSMAPPIGSEDFPTFAGDERRNKSSASRADVGGLQFVWDLDLESNGEREEATVTDLRLPHFPSVVGSEAFAATDSAVWKFDLKSGRSVRWLDFAGGRADSKMPRARYSVTIKDGRLFAVAYDQRGGGTERRVRGGGFGRQRDWHSVSSTLYCFDLATQQELWKATPSDFGAERGAVFEATPLAVGSDLCIGVTRYDAMSETSVLRIAAADRRLLWKSVVCESMTDGAIAEPPLYNMLTLDDSTLYYCTNLGAVAALQADTGRIAWAATYTRRSPPTSAPGDPSVPDVNPCVVHQGRVFALPRDGRRLLCYDAQTGEKQWESPASLSFSHIIGAEDGVVVATGSKVCAFDIATGKLRWIRPVNNSPGFGRGIIAAGDVYWPTRTDIHVFQLKTGEISRPPIELFTRHGQRPGNLLHAGEYLLVAQSNRLLAFCSYSKLIDRHRKEIVANPESAEPRFKLAEALFQHGDFEAAAESFAKAAELAGPMRTVFGRKMTESANDRRFESLLARALKSKAPESRAAFARAAEVARTPDQTVKALAAEFAAAEDPQRRAAVCQRVLDSKLLRPAMLALPDGRSEPAGKWAARTLQSLVDRHGRVVYALYERELEKLLAGNGKSDAELAELSERFPLGFTLAKTLLARADRLSKAKASDEVNGVAKRLLHIAASSKDRELEIRAVGHLAANERALGREASAYFWAARTARLKVSEWPRRPMFDDVDFDVEVGANAAATITPQSQWRRTRVTASNNGATTTLQWNPADGAKATVEVAGGISWMGLLPSGLAVANADELMFFKHVQPVIEAWKKPFRTTKRFRRAKDDPNVRAPTVTASPERFHSIGDLVIVAADDAVIALDELDGSERWRISTPTQSEQPAVLEVADATLFIHRNGGTSAVDPATGSELFATPNRVLSAAAAGGILAVAKDRTTIVGRDQRTGAERWTMSVPAPTTCDPKLLGRNGSLVALIDGSRLASIESASGKIGWRAAFSQTPVVGVEGVIGEDAVCLLMGSAVECREVANGDVRWRRPLDSEVRELRLAVSADAVTVWEKGGPASQTFLLKDGSQGKIPRKL
jgi:outer membrane protein assembly factor BamB